MEELQIFSLFGIREKILDQVASQLTLVLRIPFQGRNSDLWGDYYIARDSEGKELFKLKTNYNVEEGELTWPEYEEYPLIMEAVVASEERASEVESLLLKSQKITALLLRKKI